MSKTAKSWQSYGNGHLPYHCSYYFLARALVYDATCDCVRSNNAQKHNNLKVKSSRADGSTSED